MKKNWDIIALKTGRVKNNERNKTVEEALEKADSFINKYYFFRKLEKVKRENGHWLVQYDVSVIGPKISAVVKIDANTGGVIEYTTNE